jgi:translation initiation factor IF-2
VQRGTLKVGDAIVAGDAWGRVKALYDYRGERIESALPGEPVEILGFDKPPPAGELGRVVENDRKARELAQQREERLRRESLAKQASRGVSLEKLFEQLQAGGVADLNIVLKGDVQGSVEAIVGELDKIEHPEVRVNVIHTGVGAITENDINLAAASGAMVVGFNVRPSTEARQLAERQGIEIRQYRVIYQLTEDIQQALVGMLSPVETEAVIGEVEVRALFRVSRLGTIAGCMVTSGIVRRGASVRIFREGTRIHETTVAQLKRFKDDAREVAEGFECGILLDGFNDLREGDVFEVYETREVERTSNPELVRASERRLRRDPGGRAALPGGWIAQGEAQVRQVGEGPAREPLRRVRGGGQPSRPLAALRPDRGVRVAGRARGGGARGTRRGVARRPGMGARARRAIARRARGHSVRP